MTLTLFLACDYDAGFGQASPPGVNKETYR
jgi:hypothetical protein